MRYLDDAYETAAPGAHAAYVTVAATCGMRIGELLGCPETAVDLPKRLLHVHQTLISAGREPEFGEPETEQGRRTIMLPDVAVHAIQRALLWKKEQRLGPKFRDAGVLFCDPYGRPIFLSNLHRRDHRPRLARLGLPQTRIHDLRHFHATFLVESGADARTVSDRLGHSSPSFTLKAYVHPAEQAQRRAASMADAMFARTGRNAR
ncbi:MAG TPA: site-specific integrase [bacterium]|nr:site-specific integrase [bacterium]